MNIAKTASIWWSFFVPRLAYIILIYTSLTLSSFSQDILSIINEILSVARYTLSEITDLRLGSTLYEISQGVVSFNINLVESTDLTTWTPHEPMEISLGE